MGAERCRAFLSALILALVVPAALAGVGHRKWIDKSAGSLRKELPKKLFGEEDIVLHPRILTVNTNDYGNNEPTPSLPKPPFKLIPN